MGIPYFFAMVKTISEINNKLRKGEAVIVRADEMPEIVARKGAKKAAEKVDVVTTATFGAMCSSGVFFNFGHSDPPIKITKCYLNEVEAYSGLAAVDAYLGATELSRDRGMEYGGSHVIEDLLRGREVSLKATAYGSDCYPRKLLETSITLDDVNQATLYNPRNCYQSYNAATNRSSATLYTYMGTLLSHFRNINFAGTGELNPLQNDPKYRSIGYGTRIFLGGTQGYVGLEGTQHNPATGFGTLSLTGDLKEMSPDFIRAASVHEYGTSIFVGVGVPLPVLDETIAAETAVKNGDIPVGVFDYGVQRSSRPKVLETNYQELYSGRIEFEGKTVKSAPLSSMRKTHDILEILGDWLESGEFELTEPAYRLSRTTQCRPLKEKAKVPCVAEIMVEEVITAGKKDDIETLSQLLIKNDIDQVPVTEDGRLIGIVTALDITKGLAEGMRSVTDIMTADVITSSPQETLDEVSRRLDKKGINSTPVVDKDGLLKGIITLGDINRVYGRSLK